MMKLTMDTVENFLLFLKENGRSKSTIETYQRIVKNFYQYLPEEKLLAPDTLFRWQRDLVEKGYAGRTINQNISVINNFLQFLGKRGWQCLEQMEKTEEIQPELTRAEYMRLLQTAKRMEKQRTYLLIKTLCIAGVKLSDLEKLTVEILERNDIFEGKKQIPAGLRQELLQFAKEKQIRAGPVFVTRNGVPMNRSNIWNDIQSVCAEARVAEEKANPRCLWRLYQNTYKSIEDNISVLVEQAYGRMLDKEELTIGWEK